MLRAKPLLLVELQSRKTDFKTESAKASHLLLEVKQISAIKEGWFVKGHIVLVESSLRSQKLADCTVQLKYPCRVYGRVKNFKECRERV